MHSSHTLREGARPGGREDILGHANIDVTQNFTARAGGESIVRKLARNISACIGSEPRTYIIYIRRG